MIQRQKIGVITHYYNSINYGGVLQSFALIEALKELGFDAKQICFDTTMPTQQKKSIKTSIKKVINTGFDVLMRRRYEKFSAFRNQMINHTDNVYNCISVNACNEEFDTFITGSDQVWNMNYYYPAYFLDFVSPSKTKIAYAASVGLKDLRDDQKQIISGHLEGFKYISVREKDTKMLLQPLTEIQIEHTLDPTLLLNEGKWRMLVQNNSNYNYKNEYALCYFIGDDTKLRVLAKKLLKRTSLKKVSIPHPAGLNMADFFLGGKKEYDAGPFDFISLIMNSDLVLTDSFHAVVFSIIFEKQFFVFPRKGKKEMSNRIISLLSLIKAEDRFIENIDNYNIVYRFFIL